MNGENYANSEHCCEVRRILIELRFVNCICIANKLQKKECFFD